MTDNQPLFIGIGSPHGDDQVGWLVIKELENYVDGARCRLAKTPGQLLNWLDSVSELILCDAVDAQQPPGTVHVWIWPAPEIVRVPFRGSHDLSLPSTLELADRLSRLPARVTIWGVQIGDASPLQGVSPAVAECVPAIAKRIYEEWRRA